MECSINLFHCSVLSLVEIDPSHFNAGQSREYTNPSLSPTPLYLSVSRLKVYIPCGGRLARMAGGWTDVIRRVLSLCTDGDKTSISPWDHVGALTRWNHKSVTNVVNV